MGAPSKELRIAQALGRIGLALRHRARRHADQQDLSPLQAQALITLLHAKVQGLCMKELAEQLAVRMPAASEAVATLVDKGFVRKNTDVRDGRVVRLTLTSRGRREADTASHWPDFMASAVHVLDAPERTVLLRALIKMITDLQWRGDVPLGRMCVDCRFFRPNAHSDPNHPHHCEMIDAPIGDADLRVDCPEHERLASAAEQSRVWRLFVRGRASDESPSPSNWRPS